MRTFSIICLLLICGACSSQNQDQDQKKVAVTPPPATTTAVSTKPKPPSQNSASQNSASQATPSTNTEKNTKADIPQKALLHPALSLSNIFETVEGCEKIKNGSKECFQAASTAGALHLEGAPQYPSIELCQNVFKKCMARNDGVFSPLMEGFGFIAVDSRDPSKGVFHLPLYKTKSNSWVEVKLSGEKLELVPIQ